jgi:hypothetical protein
MMIEGLRRVTCVALNGGYNLYFAVDVVMNKASLYQQQKTVAQICTFF